MQPTESESVEKKSRRTGIAWLMAPLAYLRHVDSKQGKVEIRLNLEYLLPNIPYLQDSMATLLRSLYPTARASCSRRTIVTAAARFAPSSSTLKQQQSPASPLERDVIQPDANDSTVRSTRSTPIPEALVEASELSKLAPTTRVDDWWAIKRNTNMNNPLNVAPGNQYTGRSVKVAGGRTFQQAYRQVMGVLSRTGTRKDVRDSEYFEKPHVMRNRQKSERHRRRFQEMVSIFSFHRDGCRGSMSGS